MRLLYVALTRAEKGLLLLSSAGGAGKSGEPKRLGWAKILHEMTKDSNQQHWALRTVDIKNTHRVLPIKSAATVSSNHKLVAKIQNARLNITPQRDSISFSHLMEQCNAIDSPGSMKKLASSENNRERGDEFHKALANVDWLNADPVWTNILKSEGPIWLETMRADKDLLHPTVFKEKRFLLPLNKFIFEGVIDHGILHADGSWLLYDWKTGEKASDLIYQYQAKLYALAILNLTARPDKVKTIWWDLPNNQKVIKEYSQAEAWQMADDIHNWTEDILKTKS
jgi:ATP-dependent exoDNAse (exonuclease V) beta subunit